MQPDIALTLTRPWYWGHAIVGAPDAMPPERRGDFSRLVVAGASALHINMRHAQDLDDEALERGDDWALGTIHLRSLDELDEPLAPVHYEGVLELADGRLSLGDAATKTILTGLARRTRIRVQAHDASRFGATEVWIDLAPEEM